MVSNEQPPIWRGPVAGLLTWLVPGLGHLFLGDRARGLILMVTITVTFWAGIAIGGVRTTVDPQQRGLWFTAQLCAGGHTLTAYAIQRSVNQDRDNALASIARTHWRASDIGVHYTGVAGLLSLLVVFDAISRADRVPHPVQKKKRPPGRQP